ncbi:MAG TPA: hypothetical protein ENI86_14110, partial [Acidimicrobiales bacterium]|nr:hypothetical protein [Acidimicrobiales bacterium]
MRRPARRPSTLLISALAVTVAAAGFLVVIRSGDATAAEVIVPDSDSPENAEVAGSPLADLIDLPEVTTTTVTADLATPGESPTAELVDDSPTTTSADNGVSAEGATADSVDLSSPAAVRSRRGEIYFEGDFPDPFVLIDGSEVWAYSTTVWGVNVPVARVSTLGLIHTGEDALPEVGSWSVNGFVWAPAVARVGDRFVLYYTSYDVASDLMCIGTAVSDRAEGPFVDNSDSPLICPTAEGGAIDASPFVAGNTLFLLYKADGNCCGLPTTIYTQQLSPDGLATMGDPVALLGADQPWEGNLVEAPSMIRAGGRYHLMFSANDWNSADYAVGHAVCDTPVGPCTVVGDGPVLDTNEQVVGPGGAEFFMVGPRPWVVYHGWVNGVVGYDNGSYRGLFVEPVGGR